MRYKLLGKSGLRVSELCLGAMTFGEEWGWGTSKDESRQIFDAYAEAGGNFIDTANMYTNGTSEKMVGEFVAKDRGRFVIATKYTFPIREKDPNSGGNHRKSLVQSVERSLSQMKLDFVDLLWVHAWDELTPVDEVMRALDDLVRAGKILYVGVSDYPAWLVARANTLAELKGWTPFIALQIQYSLVERTPERDLIPMARALGITITPWSPLGGGVLTGKYNNGGGQAVKEARLSSQWQHLLSKRNLAIASVVLEAARETGRSASQVALAWIRAQGSDMIPIIGSRRLAQIKDNMACLDLTLTSAQLKRLDEASFVDMGFPHDFIASDRIREMLSAGTFDQIDKDHIPGLRPTVALK
jgi:aryl-alcohol dehydrogenase-like predicted oxidoreductase